MVAMTLPEPGYFRKRGVFVFSPRGLGFFGSQQQTNKLERFARLQEGFATSSFSLPSRAVRPFTSAALRPLGPPMFNISEDATGIGANYLDAPA